MDKARKRLNINEGDPKDSTSNNELLLSFAEDFVQHDEGQSEVNNIAHDNLKHISLHTSAAKSLIEQSEAFGSNLLDMAAILASKEGLDAISKRHVMEANHILLAKEDNKGTLKQVFQLLGGIFLGAALPGYLYALLPLITAYLAGEQPPIVNPLEIVIYTVLLLIGAILIVYSVMKKNE